MKTAFQVRPQGTRVQPTLNKFVNDFFNSSFSDIVDREFIITRPAVNVLEREDAFELSIAAPGLSKERFSIEIENDVLTIQANLEENNTEDQPSFKRREFNYAGFKRTFKLNSMLNADQISATYEAGILSVSIPKVEKQTKKITIA